MKRGMVSARYRWAVVAMLWLVCFFNYADRQAIFSVFPLLREEMGLSNVQLGIVAGAFMWVYAAFLPRRTQRRKDAKTQRKEVDRWMGATAAF